MEKKCPEEYIVNSLKEAILAEEIASSFYRYLSKQIKNGRTREVFKKMSDEEAGRHKCLLANRLKAITGDSYNPDISKIDNNIEVSSFSLAGAIAMAKHSEKKAIKFYNKAKKQDKKEYEYIYKEIINDEKKHWKYLDKEKKFIDKHKQFNDDPGLRMFSLLSNMRI